MIRSCYISVLLPAFHSVLWYYQRLIISYQPLVLLNTARCHFSSIIHHQVSAVPYLAAKNFWPDIVSGLIKSAVFVLSKLLRRAVSWWK